MAIIAPIKLYFCDYSDDGCVLAETCNWLYLTKVVFGLSVLYFWWYCKHNGDKSIHVIHIIKPTMH